MSAARTDTATRLPAPPRCGADAAWALFLDVDGTLLDFASQPDKVEVGACLLADLAQVRRRLNGAVALLSGRPLSQLDALFDWHVCPAAGLHGAELRAADGSVHVIGDATGFETARARARELVKGTPGVMLEDKQRALALHYRQAPRAADAALQIAAALIRAAGDGYALQHGDHVVELKPAGADKGSALAALMREAPFRDRTPWMLGDDLTDEDAFRHVNAVGGTSVIVGTRQPTAARFQLANPAAVRAWLHERVTRAH